MRTLWARAITMLICCSCAANPASAQKQDGIVVAKDRTVRADASIIPSDVTLFISIENASELRQLPTGKFVESALTALVPEGNIRAAWRELARVMGMSPEQTFDQLLGTRVALAARKNPQGPPSWAVICEIDKPTYKRLMKGLGGAPREMINNRPILALEQGQFLLTAIYGKRKGASLALLAPRENADLFKEIARSLGGVHKQPLLMHPDFARARKLDPKANILFFTRRAVAAKNENDEIAGGGAGIGNGIAKGRGDVGGGWLALSALAQDNNISIKGLSFSPNAPKPTFTWSAKAFETMSKDALVCIVDDALLAAMPFDPIAFLNVTQFDHLDFDDLLTSGWALRVREQGGALSLEEAARTPSVSKLAPRADRIIAEVLAEQLANPAIIDDSFEGFDPSVTRSVSLASLADNANKSPLGPAPAIAWRFDQDDPPQAESDAGWWVLATSPAAVNQLSADLAAARSTNNDPWLALGLLRPAKIVERLSQMGPALALLPFADPLSRVDAVEWRAAPIDNLLFVEVNIQLIDHAHPPK